LSELASLVVTPDDRSMQDAQDLDYQALLMGFRERYSIEFATDGANVSVKCGVRRPPDTAYHYCTFFPSEMKIFVLAVAHYLCHGVVAADWLSSHEGRWATRSNFKDLSWF
jgi:hypothetical protein